MSVEALGTFPNTRICQWGKKNPHNGNTMEDYCGHVFKAKKTNKQQNI